MNKTKPATTTTSTNRPQAPQLVVENIPPELKSIPNWVCWLFERRGTRWTKVPVNPHSGASADTTDPATWSSFEQALDVYQQLAADGLAGVGFVFSGDAYTGVDLDQCRDPGTGRLEPWAVCVLRLLRTYSEVSPFRSGVKLWCKGKLPFEGKSGGRRPISRIPELAKLSPNSRAEIEMYSHSRFFTMTGERLDSVRGHPLPADPRERTQELAALHRLCFSSDNTPPKSSDTGPTSRLPTREVVPNDMDGDEIIRRATNAANGERFKLLWEGKWTEAGYPSQSEADLALCLRLAFWTGRDAGKIDMLFRQSGLYRPKWETGSPGNTYGCRTVQKAVTACADVYTSHHSTTSGSEAGKEKEKRKDKADALRDFVAMAEQQGKLFHSPDDVAYAYCGGQALAVESAAYRRWLTGLTWRAAMSVPPKTFLDEAISTLAAMAVYDSPEHPLYIRVGEHQDVLYLDLANREHQVVAIRPDGWQVVQDSPVRFRRPAGMLPLPVPVPGGNINDLRPFLNLGSDDHFRLVAGWLVAALRPVGPFPVLCLHGEHGAAKSTAARVLRGLVDPAKAALRKEPKHGHDLWVAANNSWVLTYENMSHLEPWLSDCLCVLATGGGFSTRKLYSDSEETIFEAQRPLIITGINEVASRADLLDRSLVATLPPIPDEKRRQERDFWREYELARPGILGALLDAVAGALARKDTVQLDCLPRMADFAAWITAAEEALGWPEAAFMGAFEANTEQANEIALDSDIIVPYLCRLVAGKTCWPPEGQVRGPADLLRELDQMAAPGVSKQDNWPKQPVNLARRLRRLAPALRRSGIHVEFADRRETGGQRRTPIRLVVTVPQ
jgi:primase-polymerase (primpol)-like protein